MIFNLTDLYPFGFKHGDKRLEKKHAAVQKVVIDTGFPVANSLQKNIFVSNVCFGIYFRGL